MGIKNVYMGLRVMVMLLPAIIGLGSAGYAQERIAVTGVVLDSLDSSPLPGVTVSVQGSAMSTKTNENGEYSINTPADATLVFAYLGYHTAYQPLQGSNRVDIRLSSSTEGLDEVVVVGYGQQKKISVTGAVSSVTSKELRKSSSASLAVSLAGRLSGLTSFQSAGGQPGRDDATLYLRGAATTNGKSPLILIDGVPRDNIRTLDANEIESVSVLKDASATAVFGVRGANGVILITTRRGQEGRTEFNIALDQSYNALTKEPERLHSWEYIDLRNEASANDNLTLPYTDEMREKYLNPLIGLDPTDPDYATKAAIRNYMYPDHDYYREFISRYTPQTRLNVNATGGTDKVSYFVNAAYLHQGGNLKVEPESALGYDASSWLDRYNFRSNLDYRISQSLSAYLNIGSYIEQVNMPAAWLYGGGDTNWMIRDLFYQAQTILPLTPGPTTIDGFGVEPGQIVDPGYLDRSAFEIMNRMGYRNEMRSNLNSTLGMQWDLGKLVTEGLSVKGMVSYDTRATTAMQGEKRERLYVANINYETDELSYAIMRPDESLLKLIKAADSRYNINLQGSINYARTFAEKHEVTGMILGQRDKWESTGGEIPFNVVGLAGRATYGYDNRYLAEVNVGYNGSEQFAPGNRFGFFPAVSVGWVISNESFLSGSPVLTNLKLRASYGKVGNDQIGTARFLYQDNITLGGGPLGSLGGGINQGLLGNPNIGWEIALKQNYGVDLQLLNSLSLVFDYFIENRTNILISRGTVPELQGIPLGNIPKVNMGEVDNKGFELELIYNKQLFHDFNLRIRGNYGVNKNEVKFLDEAMRDETYVYQNRTTGFSLGQAWGYKIDYSNGNGYFNTQEELDEYLSHTTYGFGTPGLGDFKYVDLNGDGTVDDKDQAPIKYTSIPGSIFGIDVGFDYKGLDFSIFFQGISRFSTGYANQGVYENIKLGTYFGYQRTAWTPERYASGEAITYPALSTQTTTNHTANDFFIMDRSFVRLRNVELGYTLPSQLFERFGVRALRIYASGQNLYVWDRLQMDHLDPENSDSLGYPITKTFNFGLNLTL
ncbi:SusC/RagA family TonB-linked outer membrane protein [Parapedobacter sp. DT-150]|uniref:SusC/RagA family TonB-linked outer membrane protein n=1 Tax=Parapedobacter sp. DT-150 TaxID=3396162 RepID=UPI003F1BA123